MKILSLELKNFRNYPSALVEFDDGLNVLYGKNASGKNEYARKRVSLLGFSLPSHDERQRNDFAGAEQGAS